MQTYIIQIKYGSNFVSGINIYIFIFNILYRCIINVNLE